MNLFHKFLGQDAVSKNKKSSIKSNRLNLSVEPLEERQMLAISVFDLHGILEKPIQAEVVAGKDTELALKVDTAKTGNAALGIQVVSGGTLDPGQIQIKGSDGKLLPQSSYSFIQNGDKTSSLIVSLPKGDYTILVKGDNGTLGSFSCDVFLPGFNPGTTGTGKGTVTNLDQLKSQSAVIQGTGNWNENTVALYNQLGKTQGFTKAQFDANQNQYATAYDVNGDGVIVAAESSVVSANAKLGEVSVTLSTTTVEVKPTLVTPLATKPTTTAVLEVKGTVSANVKKLEVRFEGGKAGYTTIEFTNGNFTLSKAQLETIYGGTVPFGAQKLVFKVTTTEDKEASVPAFEFTYVEHTKPESQDVGPKKVYANSSTAGTEIFKINDLVKTPGTVFSYALNTITLPGSTTPINVVHDEWISLGTDKGSIRYTGGTKGSDDVYYGGVIE
ncbi:MAG: hypothetical protein ACRC2T_17755, partial [Thermoguttaceae bacterium]